MRRYQNLAPWERALSVAIGTTLIGGAIRRRHLLSREAIGGVAGYCPVSHALGAPRRDDTRVALSGARGTSLKEHITIARPVREVFNFWRDLSHHPRFVRGLESVERTGDRTSRWTLRGPGGVALGWMAGRSPASELRADLRRLKELLETGDGSLAEDQPIAIQAFD